ncbi:MAG: MBL fold metallo-hydrolase, partial [Bacteroidota bacterium]
MKQFGSKATKALLERYAKSDNWRDGKFQNLEETTMSISFQTIPKLLYKQFCERKEREPKAPIPVVPFDKEAFLAPSDKAKFIWYGHSAVLMRINDQTILIDPMLGPNASPIAPFATKRYSENTLDLIDDFPSIDLLLMTHDH